MSIASLIPLILLVVVMFVMTRSAKRKQQVAQNMRNEMQPGTGVRTIGGMYATVKSVSDDAVLLEVAPGVHATYAKNAIGAVIDGEEFARVTEGALGTGLPEGFTTDDIPEDASALDEYEVEDDEAVDEDEVEAAEDERSAKIDMTKSEVDEDEESEESDETDVSDKTTKADLRKDGGSGK